MVEEVGRVGSGDGGAAEISNEDVVPEFLDEWGRDEGQRSDKQRGEDGRFAHPFEVHKQQPEADHREQSGEDEQTAEERLVVQIYGLGSAADDSVLAGPAVDP